MWALEGYDSSEGEEEGEGEGRKEEEGPPPPKQQKKEETQREGEEESNSSTNEPALKEGAVPKVTAVTAVAAEEGERKGGRKRTIMTPPQVWKGRPNIANSDA